MKKPKKILYEVMAYNFDRGVLRLTIHFNLKDGKPEDVVEQVVRAGRKLPKLR